MKNNKEIKKQQNQNLKENKKSLKNNKLVYVHKNNRFFQNANTANSDAETKSNNNDNSNPIANSNKDNSISEVDEINKQDRKDDSNETIKCNFFSHFFKNVFTIICLFLTFFTE